MWVVEAGCTDCTGGGPSFDRKASSTFQLATRDPTGDPTLLEITYGSGTVVGDLVQDTVAMGGFRVPNQPWLLADLYPTYLLEGSCSGSMGLAFDTIARTESIPFWQTLADSGQLTTPEMSFWFTRLLGDLDAQGEGFGGVFTLGGRNKTLYTGDVEFLPLVTNVGRETYWLLNVSGMFPIHACLVLGFPHTRVSIPGITVNKKNVTLPSGGTAAVDTGTTLISGPAAAVSAIYAQIPNSQPLDGSLAGYYGFRMSVS